MIKNKNIDKRRLLRYGNDENKYEFDRELRLLNLEFLEILELDFKKTFLEFLEGNNLHYSDSEIFFNKFLNKTNVFIEIKNKNLIKNDKEVRFYMENNNIISNYLFIEKMTFGEIFRLFSNLKLKNKKIIAKKYKLNVFIFENWMYSAKYIRNICSHYFNLFNINGTILTEGDELNCVFGKKSSYLKYFSIFSIFEKKILNNNVWQNKVLKLIIKYDNIGIDDLNLRQKNNLPSQLESEAWKILVNTLYDFFLKKSNKNNIIYLQKLFTRKKFSIILAIDDKNGLGKNNDLAWKISADLKYFKNITSSTTDLAKMNAVVMGRRTWDSIPSKYRPLAQRINCILTRNIKIDNINSPIDDFVLYFNSLECCLSELELKENVENIFIIGGANLYNQVLDNPLLDKIYLTKIKGNYDCDVFFDGIPNNFIVESYTDSEIENGIEYSFWVYKKIS